ncbi:hypothetical protein ABCR94_31650 [Streptomyces sp. 21So2-11]|uniref:hypothetical protein n=1 Tax=Streptomyces sp. 21So2-11 TaxID=3144408 RepID=UPI00321A143C
MRTRSTAVLAALLLAALTACGGVDKPEAKSSSTPSAADASEAAEPEPSPTQQTIFEFGDAWEFESTEEFEEAIAGAVTVFDYKQGVRSVGSAAEEVDNKDYVWAYVEIKTCSTKGNFTATTEPWTLAYGDGTRIEPSSSTWDDFPKPEYPLETKLTVGKCVRGKLVFPVPGSNRPNSVVYAPAELEVPREWTVPAK